MPAIAFTPNLQAHVACARRTVAGATVRAALEAVFAENPRLRGYVLDEQGELRRHMIIFVDGKIIQDRKSQNDPVTQSSDIFVMQALSGG